MILCLSPNLVIRGRKMYQRINVCIPNDSIQEASICNYNFDDNNQFPLIVLIEEVI